jgi:membrane-associated protein
LKNLALSEFWNFLKTLMNPESIMLYGGTLLLLIVIFAETGLLIGFFLPGDNLILVAGLFCSIKPHLLSNLAFPFLCLLMIAAAVAGNMVGFWFGKKSGPRLFTKDENIFFKKKYLKATEDFYARHGGKALIVGRFFPVVRTFAPILAGAIGINFKKFMLFNLTGAVAWILSLAGLGYFFGEFIPGIEDYLGYVLVFLIVITAIPVIRTFRKERKIKKNS